jgi:hypothetical protein
MDWETGKNLESDVDSHLNGPDYDVESDHSNSSNDWYTDLSDENSESSDDEALSQETEADDLWAHVGETRPNQFIFSTEEADRIKEKLEQLRGITPIQAIKFFINDEIIALLVTETNRKALQILERDITRQSRRLSQWQPTDAYEMHKFLALLMWMGQVRYPSLDWYWAKDNLYTNSFASNIMTKNRFLLLMRLFHFSNDNLATPGERFCKISPLIDLLKTSFQQYRTPGSKITVDETMIPFRGQLAFHEFISGRKHKYGIKMLKSCDPVGYTYNLSIHQGKEAASRAENAVFQLCEPYLDQGRVIVTDGYCTSLPLAEKLIDRKTHLLGTVGKNRKHLPKSVVSKKLQKGETVGRENNKGIVVFKWKDKRDVLMLSTCHGLEFITTHTEEADETKLIIGHHDKDFGIDLSDQLVSYCLELRRSLKW